MEKETKYFIQDQGMLFEVAKLILSLLKNDKFEEALTLFVDVMGQKGQVVSQWPIDRQWLKFNVQAIRECSEHELPTMQVLYSGQWREIVEN